jgi:uroporphyrinogen III methyltransferase/synthase
MAGKIYLVGAGPGDPGLLTLKGRRCLAQADVVIYDYLANPRLLDHAPPTAIRVLVGKHGGGTAVEQSVISTLIVEHARQGKVVVRLKGGDPFIFGRGAEEAAAAREAGLTFEVVPGVTSATAVPAYAGIPLTHRELASTVIITTGYEYPSKAEPVVRWGELARSGATLVILMTQRQLRNNMAALVAGGLPAEMPVAIVEWGTRCDQRTVTGTAMTIGDLAEAHGIKPPALAVVGPVVRLREHLTWFERLPLFGRRIVITRPRAQAAAFADRLEASGAEVVPFPTIEIVPPDSYAALDEALARPADFAWVVFTSVNGVRAFFDRLRVREGDIRTWHGARVAAIGSQTAAALAELGIRVDIVPEEFRAEAVVAELARQGVREQRILLPRAAGAREVLPAELRRLGAVVDDVAAYQSVPPRAEQIEEVRQLVTDGDVDLITFTSSSTVRHFVAAIGTKDAAACRVPVGCIGPVTAETARDYGMTVVVQPPSYTAAALADAVHDYFRRHNPPRRRERGGSDEFS